eukprot:Selendium_serpulae@DN5073_c0_g1_i1.p1
MMSSRYISFCFFLLFVLLCRQDFVQGWNLDGHMAIGQTAMSAMRANAVSQVKRLTRGKDVVDVAGWADKVRARYPSSEPLHVQLQSGTDACEVVSREPCKNNWCLVAALTHFFGRLTSQNLKQVTYPDGITQLTDADALKYLINFIGELHQPLHVGNILDEGGRQTLVKHGKDTDTKIDVPLYDVWNNDMIQKYRTYNAKFWDGGWTHVNSIGKAFYQAEKAKWDEYPLDQKEKAFMLWAEASRKYFCDSIMSLPGGEKMTNGTDISPSVEHLWMEDIKRQILHAGVRTAIVLNSVLEQREVAGKLRQGSGIDLKDDDKKATFPLWIRNLATNLLILVVVLLVFVYITKFYSGPSGSSSHAKPSRATRPKSPDRSIKMKAMAD